MFYWRSEPRGWAFTALGDWSVFPGGAPSSASAWLKRVVEGDRERAVAAWKEALRLGRPLAMDFRMRAANGAPRWFRCRVVPQVAATGEPEGFLGSFEDISPEVEMASWADEALTVAKLLVDSSPLPTSVVHQESGRLIYCNDQLVDLLGIRGEPQDHLRPEQFYEDSGQCEAFVARLRTEGRVEDFQCRMKRLDGTLFWGGLTGQLIQLHEGPCRIVTTRDVTRSREAQDWLIDREVRFRRLFEDHAALMLLVRPEDGRILDANRAASRFYGYSLDRIRSMTLSEINTLDPDLIRVHMAQTLAGKASHWVYPHRLASGETRIVDVESVPITLGQDTVLFSILHDVTERKRAESALKRSEWALSQAQELGGMGHFLLDLDSGQVETSAALDPILNLRGEPPQDLDGLRRALEPAFVDGLLQAAEEARGPQEFQGEFALAVEGQRLPRWLHVRSLLEGRREGEPRLVLGTVQDVTQRRRQEMLGLEMEAQVAKGRMAAYVAHEINGPLAGIKNAFLLVEAALPEGHPDRRFATLIKSEIKRISAIVKMLYELHRPIDPSPVEVDVVGVVQDIRTVLASYGRSRRVKLLPGRMEVARPVLLKINPLRQILYNLVQNAIEASPPGGRVTIQAGVAEGRVTLGVTDQGPGIPDALSERIWEQGFSTKQASPQGGLGLGLATCRRLATCMGGTLQFKNEAGTGCTFILRLPEARSHGRVDPSIWEPNL
jgi:PAS domain S-box-containing protein